MKSTPPTGLEAPNRPLGEVAAVRLGYSPPRERVDTGPDARELPAVVAKAILLIQPSHLTSDGTLDWPRLEQAVVPSDHADSHALEPGTVILCLRGVMRVAHLTEHTLQREGGPWNEGEPVLASSAWAVICPRIDELHADYLVWQLKLPQTVRRLHGARAGTLPQFIPLSKVRELEIPMPPLGRQAAIARAAGLIDRIEHLEQARMRELRAYLGGAVASSSATRRARTNTALTKRRQ